MQMRKAAKLLLDYLRHAGRFLVASAGVAALMVVVLPFLGYDTFGDRPGAGWHGTPTRPTRAAVVELLNYALALPLFGAIGVAIFFVVPFAVVRLLERTAVHLAIVRAVGALLCGEVAFLVIGAGWYISLGIVA